MIRSSTQVVVVNVVVKDKHGKPADDLKREDFELRDNGQPQKIALFSMDETKSAIQTPFGNAPLTFTNRPALGGARATAFLFDELNTRLSDQQSAKKQFVDYLQHLPPTERVAVFVLGDSLHMLHDFSDDTASLIASVSKHSNRAGQEVAASTTPAPTATGVSGSNSMTSQWDDFLSTAQNAYRDYAETVRALRTSEALQVIAEHLRGVPGRKTLIWISGGFPIELGLHGSGANLPKDSISASQSRGKSGKGGGGASSGPVQARNTGLAELPGTQQSFEDDVKRSIAALNEADVAVYPVDARGVIVAAPFQADRASYGKSSRQPKANLQPDYNYDTLEKLANETGGRAFHHLNDLNHAVQDAMDDARVSYSLTFYPAAETLDDSYHKLQVEIHRPGVTAHYRLGYQASKQAGEAPKLSDAITDPIARSGIGFTAHLAPTEGGYSLSLVIDPRNVTLESKDGKWIGSMQFLVVVGQVEQLTNVPLSLTDAVYRAVQEKGLTLGARVKAPPGATGFSIGLRDVPTGVVGTLHVPLS